MIKKRLMIVNCVFPPYIGGSGFISYHIAKFMTNFFDVYIFTGGEKKIIEKYNNLTIIRIKTFDKYSPLKDTDYINKEAEIIFTNIIKKYKIDILHFHSIQGLGATLIEKAYKMNKKVIITMHDFWWITPFLFLHDENFVNKPIFEHEKYCSNILDSKKLEKRNIFLEKVLSLPKLKITVVSKKLKEIIEYYYGNKFKKELKKLKIIKNGLPDYFFDKCINISPENNKNITFGYIGTLNYSKGWDILLKAVNFLNLLEVKFNLLVLSNQKYKNLKNVNFIPPMPNEKVIDLFYNKINCLIVPSTVNESFSLSAHEAIALDKFLISSNMGALAEIKSKLHITYSPYFNFYELAKKMFYLIKNYKKLNHNLKENNYKYKIEKISNICYQYKKIYEK